MIPAPFFAVSGSGFAPPPIVDLASWWCRTELRLRNFPRLAGCDDVLDTCVAADVLELLATKKNGNGTTVLPAVQAAKQGNRPVDAIRAEKSDGIGKAQQNSST